MLLKSRFLIRLVSKRFRHEHLGFNYLGPGDKGAPQWWKSPVYYSPAVNPLERGKDFTLLNGKKMPITSESELQRRLMQVGIGKRIVQCLAEMKQAEELHDQEHHELTAKRQRRQSQMPIEKGEKNIV